MANKYISMAVIRRLPKYHRCLGNMLGQGKKRISSKELSKAIGFSASQIRQDFNNFGAFGQQGYGYNIKELYSEIEKIIGLTRQYSVIVVGAGHLANALIKYGFKDVGFKIESIFDIDQEKIGKDIEGIEILDINILETYLSNNNIDIAVITTPAQVAQDVSDRLCISGVSGIWNFSQVDLVVPENVELEDIHMVDSLMTLTYLLNQNK